MHSLLLRQQRWQDYCQLLVLLLVQRGVCMVQALPSAAAAAAAAAAGSAQQQLLQLLLLPVTAAGCCTAASPLPGVAALLLLLLRVFSGTGADASYEPSLGLNPAASTAAVCGRPLLLLLLEVSWFPPYHYGSLQMNMFDHLLLLLLLLVQQATQASLAAAAAAAAAANLHTAQIRTPGVLNHYCYKPQLNSTQRSTPGRRSRYHHTPAQ
jgi:hypothetical protein